MYEWTEAQKSDRLSRPITRVQHSKLMRDRLEPGTGVTKPDIAKQPWQRWHCFQVRWVSLDTNMQHSPKQLLVQPKLTDQC